MWGQLPVGDKDKRIGLTCTPKPELWTHDLYGERGEIVAVLPSGAGGVVDSKGVLQIRMQSGRVLLSRASEWEMIGAGR